MHWCLPGSAGAITTNLPPPARTSPIGTATSTEQTSGIRVHVDVYADGSHKGNGDAIDPRTEPQPRGPDEEPRMVQLVRAVNLVGGRHRANEALPPPHQSPTYSRKEATTGPEFIGMSSGEVDAETGRPACCVNAVTSFGYVVYVLGLVICVAPHGLQQTADHSFFLLRNPPGERSLQCGTVR